MKKRIPRPRVFVRNVLGLRVRVTIRACEAVWVDGVSWYRGVIDFSAMPPGRDKTTMWYYSDKKYRNSHTAMRDAERAAGIARVAVREVRGGRRKA